jgi:hypothetical protein
MEFGYRFDGQASVGKRDSGDIFLFPTTSAGKDEQHDSTRERFGALISSIQIKHNSP